MLSFTLIALYKQLTDNKKTLMFTQSSTSKTMRDRDTHRDRQRDRQTGRQADRQAGRQADRQTEKHTHREFHKHRTSCKNSTETCLFL